MAVVAFQLYRNLFVNIILAMDSAKEKLSEPYWDGFFYFATSHSELNTQECSKRPIGNGALWLRIICMYNSEGLAMTSYICMCLISQVGIQWKVQNYWLGAWDEPSYNILYHIFYHTLLFFPYTFFSSSSYYSRVFNLESQRQPDLLFQNFLIVKKVKTWLKV